MNAETGLVSVLYSSRAEQEFTDQQLADLLQQSRASNARNDVTGILLYRGGRFLQFLEGPSDTVRELLAAIETDARHSRVQVLLEQPIERRQFAEWTMGYQPSAAPVEPLPAGFRSTFDDLDEAADANTISRAAYELTLWYRARATT